MTLYNNNHEIQETTIIDILIKNSNYYTIRYNVKVTTIKYLKLISPPSIYHYYHY